MAEPFLSFNRLIRYMHAVALIPSEAELWRAYRGAFRSFADSVERVTFLAAHGDRGAEAIDTALLEMERARILYNDRRDALARQLLQSSASVEIPAPAPDSAQSHVRHVRDIAELRWELAGRPQGTAEDDWHRAEEIVRQAAA